ncbi:dephospho-CoA kinase domain-containing protein-like [Liolophura sinensis]|uniref:dephospho-CoA kinase domain-containing protein-like n=1 Tax=Liolophura sinensis TaxID=3198878 RepID=UPI00315957A8
MFLVGLTGGIATGKSTVSEIFRDLGCCVVDADQIAREVVKPGRRAWKKIRGEFGDGVFLSSGELNREKLGQIIFADSDKRKLLNSITHPEIYKCMAWEVLKAFLSGHQFVILDLPLLFETRQMLPYISYTVVVACSAEDQLDRLMKRNGYEEDEARRRIDAQMSLAEKVRRATYIVNNEGSREATRQHVEQLHCQLCASRAQWKLRLGLVTVIGLLTIIGIYALG